MKIVYFIDHLRADGAQYVLKQLVEGLKARGHTQVVLCLNDSWDEPFRQKLVAAGASVHIVGKRALAMGYGWWWIYRFLRQERFDVAVTILFVSDVIGRLLAHLANVPRIVTSIQTHNINYAWWQCMAVKMTMQWVDMVLLSSPNIRDFVIAREGASPDRLAVIPNTIRLQNYTQTVDRSRLRAELDLPSDQIILGSVGRLTYQKSYDVLLQAFALVPRQDIVLVIAGVGEDEVSLRALVAKLGLQNRVCFLGYRHDVPQLMPSFNVYVHASRFEGLPIVVLEAIASGCPVVATAVDGTRELIEDGLHGWLVPPEQPQLFAQAIQAALDDPAEANRRARAARRRVADKFSFDVVLDLWEKAFRGQLH